MRILSVGRWIAFAAVTSTLFAQFGFQVSRVDGFSMAPTLWNDDRLIVNKLVYEFSDPRPGDVVTFYDPPNPSRLLVKRVIAREGDTVQIVDGHVLVNHQPLADDYVVPAYRDHDNWGPEVVEPGYDFVLGDHRNDSSDSRDWGFVPRKYIVGKVHARWWPLHDATFF